MTAQQDLSPTTGVYNGYDCGYMYDDEAIDLDYDIAYTILIDQGYNDGEACTELECFDGTTYLYGSWTQDADGLWGPDMNDDPEAYAAIYDSNTNVCQVVWSNTIRFGRPASPCYPNQVDARLDDPDRVDLIHTMKYYALHPNITTVEGV